MNIINIHSHMLHCESKRYSRVCNMAGVLKVAKPISLWTVIHYCQQPEHLASFPGSHVESLGTRLLEQPAMMSQAITFFSKTHLLTHNLHMAI